MYFYFTYFKTIKNYKSTFVRSSDPKVTVLICAHNEEENLKKNLHKVLSQKYSDFEVVIVDDRSIDNTSAVVESFDNENIKLIKIESCSKGTSSKKNALTKGFEIASGEFVLLTDADCYPNSDEWISIMVSKIKKSTDLVLGYSPYEQRSGFLNKLIQFDTFFTAIQYVSFALKGEAYMGVGRNLLVRKSAFKDVNGFDGFMDVMAGDDDIIVQKIANRKNVSVSLESNSYINSIPKDSFSSWINQKRRHLTVGFKYKNESKLKIGIFQQSFVLMYLSSFLLILLTFNLMSIFIIVCLLTLRMLILYKKLLRIFNSGIPIYKMVFLEILYFVSFFLIGFSVIVSKKSSWQ